MNNPFPPPQPSIEKPDSSSGTNKVLVLGVVAIVVAIIVAAIIISSSGEDAAAPAPTPAPTTQPQPAPTTESDDYEYCGISGPGIEPTGDLSVYTPDNWSDYCEGFVYGYYNHEEFPGVCDEFWETDDADLVALFVSPEGGSNSFDEAIGLVDALWVAC